VRKYTFEVMAVSDAKRRIPELELPGTPSDLPHPDRIRQALTLLLKVWPSEEETSEKRPVIAQPPRLYTVNEVARLLQVSVSTVNRLLRAGKLGSINISPLGDHGRSRRVSARHLEDFLNGQPPIK
jgi:excisionase family DNA binding protein